MSDLKIGLGTAEDFFARGKTLARKLDKGAPIQPLFTLTFEDPADMIDMLTKNRLNIFRSVKHDPASITMIACRLHRDRSAVKRDVDVLAAAGIVAVEEVLNPGHGKQKIVRAVAEKIDMHVMID